MASITRLGACGHGTRRTGSFAGKATASHPVDRITRLGAQGHNTQRTGSFAGKASGGTHPVGLITRLGAAGYNTRRCGSFAGKTPSSGGTHPVGRITRLGAWGHNTRRCGSFAGKEPSITPIVVATQEQGGHGKRQYENLDIARRRKSAREERELIEIMTALIRGGAL